MFSVLFLKFLCPVLALLRQSSGGAYSSISSSFKIYSSLGSGLMKITKWAIQSCGRVLDNAKKYLNEQLAFKHPKKSKEIQLAGCYTILEDHGLAITGRGIQKSVTSSKISTSTPLLPPTSMIIAGLGLGPKIMIECTSYLMWRSILRLKTQQLDAFSLKGLELQAHDVPSIMVLEPSPVLGATENRDGIEAVTSLRKFRLGRRSKV
ncbi:hypothetical protein BT96DRAFT_978787 [Gymnopus androsaceus JB14]|uniref:Uncharacterized protein n=1 Tax=Gymnopus androsaceus JB14 TaxID=1447944 RepID=A0A6A4H6C6_9AGAR|nr:hypothetical protein BT96DRAFT_978787 [Gymnopus androsaceus JB14]